MANREQLIEELKALLDQNVADIKDQVDRIKSQFYTTDPDAADAEPTPEGETNPLEDEFKQLLAQYKAKRAERAAAEAAEQAENLKRKQAILEEMRAIAETESGEVMGQLQRMRELQAEWKAVGPVAPEHVQELRKAYQQYQEQFYDLLKINIELRDLDFKKNLELKTLLCEAAEKLQQNANVVEASRALQQLHEEWAEIGPVARELREDLWNRFKAASTIINKKHQEYFDQLHAKEKDNLERKRAIIEQLKQIDFRSFNSSKQWEEAAERVQALQDEWRKIGFAPKKYNQSVYDEYRAICNDFFREKTAFYKTMRDALNENLQRKRNLIDGVREYAQSGDWKGAAQHIRDMQAEWREIGPVPRKYADQLWQEFRAACDEFFNAKRENDKEERGRARIERFAKKGEEGLLRMRDRLQQEIKTAENNILFFTAKSKTANKLVDSMQQKINALKKQLDEIQDKIDNEE